MSEAVTLYKVRAKFFVSDINVYSINPPQRKITFKPVYSTDPNHENKQFWDATPQGDLNMTINNPAAAEFFEPGKEYYLDFQRSATDAAERLLDSIEVV